MLVVSLVVDETSKSECGDIMLRKIVIKGQPWIVKAVWRVYRPIERDKRREGKSLLRNSRGGTTRIYSGAGSAN